MNLRINSRGKLVEIPNVGRVVVPTFEIYQNPTIRISDVKKRRFNLIDRTVQKSRQQIMAQEDEAVFKAIDEGSDNDI